MFILARGVMHFSQLRSVNSINERATLPQLLLTHSTYDLDGKLTCQCLRNAFSTETGKYGRPFWVPSHLQTRVVQIRMKVASLRSDYLPTLSAAITSKLSLLVKHHILAIDEAS